MRPPDVSTAEMHDDVHDEAVATFLGEMRATFRVVEVPPPGPALASMFAAGLANDKGDLLVTAGSNANGSAPQMAGLPNWTRRRAEMLKGLLGAVGTKVAAGALGAALAVSGLGASGALNSTYRMISGSQEEASGCESLVADETGTATAEEGAGEGAADTEAGVTTGGEATGEDGTVNAEEACEDPAEEEGPVPSGEGDGGTEALLLEDEGAEDDPAPAAPGELTCDDTSNHGCWVSYAANNKSHTCANHGAYVSQVARAKGSEQDAVFDTDCSGDLSDEEKAAQAAALGGTGEGTTDAEGAELHDADGSDLDANEPESETKDARAKGKGAKGKGGHGGKGNGAGGGRPGR